MSPVETKLNGKIDFLDLGYKGNVAEGIFLSIREFPTTNYFSIDSGYTIDLSKADVGGFKEHLRFSYGILYKGVISVSDVFSNTMTFSAVDECRRPIPLDENIIGMIKRRLSPGNK